MSYSKTTIAKVMDEYRLKAARARADATARREELQSKYSEIREIDAALSNTGFAIYNAVSTYPSDSRELENALDALKDENLSLQRKKADFLVSHGYPSDYAKIKYDCELCGDTGYRGIEMCSCMRLALNRVSFSESGLGKLSENQRFDNFDLSVYPRETSDGRIHSSYEIMKRNYEICFDYARDFTRSSPSLLLIGGVGLGKTHLSSAIGRELISKGFYVIYESAPNILLSFERERFSKDDSIDTDKYYECDMLIIDDLGTEFSSRVSLSNVYNIINTRLIEAKPTLINTNLAYKQLEKQYESRIISRLFGEFKVLLFEGIDFRRLRKG